ncbi:hypothetical protein [Rhodopseudomonas pseudopalustris]|uniref:Uncharacterized protein n=1 Tax=Rhodopseudomonas pseudopalustris TaxID=1513892 RepID=A0A1H8LSF7_9BRAD|nr:hypothetical protein [Rhodopseudomonas pseudopalustris]SEO08041.1 hypothetical protein SAMN05444123_101202 [Rhodopseudomonas pseudopalustris]
MTEFDDGDFDGMDEQDAREALTRKMRTEGAIIAYRTAVAICLDPKATAAAKASAVNSLLRAGGFFADQDADDEKAPHEMTPNEINAALQKVEAQLAQREAGPSQGRAPPQQRRKGGLFD